MSRWMLIGGLAVVMGVCISCNPFAPAYDPDGLSQVNVLGDPRSIDGYFKRFKNAYELRDTTLYGALFSTDFAFAYYDQELGQEIQWDRDTELTISYRLFQEVIQINLDWNYFIQLDSTALEAFVVRNFNLTIDTDEDNSFSGSGRARFRLRRATVAEPWEAYYWFDDSDF
ncbi:MAG: hypothetical protein AAFV78_18035 [Bacteroidota bacterium]